MVFRARLHPVLIEDRAALNVAELSGLESMLRPLATLERVVRWAFSLVPPRDISEVIVQDEFSHDVVLAWTPGRYLVFDTT
jgi:hypothetical protein